MVLTIVPLLQDKACSTVQTARLGKIVKTRGECQRQKWIGSLPSFVELVRYAQTHRCVTEKKGGPCEGRSWKELEEVGASSHEKAKTVRSCLLDSWAYWKLPYASIWMKDPQNTQDITLKTKHKEWNGDLWMPRTQRLQNASVSKRREKKLAHNNIVIKKHVNLPQNDIRCMKTRQSLQSFQCPGLKSTLSRPKQGFNCQGQLMRATSAPSNLQGQRQSVINCCVHKCKWVHWGSRRRGGGKGCQANIPVGSNLLEREMI